MVFNLLCSGSGAASVAQTRVAFSFLFKRLGLDKAVNRVAGIVLVGCVRQIGENLTLVNHGTRQCVRRTPVERTARQSLVVQSLDVRCHKG